MAQLTRQDLNNDITANIYTNKQRLIKGNTLRQRLVNMVDSTLSRLDDLNASFGYLGIDGEGKVDVSLICAAVPSGKFLRDNGTWDSITGMSWGGITGTLTAQTDLVTYIGDQMAGKINAAIPAVPGFIPFSDGTGNGLSSSAKLSWDDTNQILKTGGQASLGDSFGLQVLPGTGNQSVYSVGTIDGVDSRMGIWYTNTPTSTNFRIKYDANTHFNNGNGFYYFYGPDASSWLFALRHNSTSYLVTTTLSLGHSATPTAGLDIKPGNTAAASMRIRAGTSPTTPNNGDVWYTTGNGFRFWTEGRSASLGPLTGLAGSYNAFYFAQSPSDINPALAGNDDITFLNGQDSVGLRVSNITKLNAFPSGLMAYVPLTLATGTADMAPLVFASGSLRTIPQAGAMEFVSDRIYFTKTTGPSREVLAYLSDLPAPAGTDHEIQLNTGGQFSASSHFVYDPGLNQLKVNGAALFGQNTGGSPTAFVDIAGAVTSKASLRLRSGTAPTSPNEGDIWQDGSAVWIHIGGVNRVFTLV
jgi:hypothetical protein